MVHSGPTGRAEINERRHRIVPQTKANDVKEGIKVEAVKKEGRTRMWGLFSHMCDDCFYTSLLCGGCLLVQMEYIDVVGQRNLAP